MKKFLALVLVAAAAFAAEGYHALNKIKVGGAGGWDYVTSDGANHRLYVSHGASIAIVDTDSGTVVGTVPDLHGVHGIAVASKLNKGFISNGQSNTVTVFDLTTFAKTAEVATGQNPDAICFEPKTQRVFTFNGRSDDSTAIDAPGRQETRVLRRRRRWQDLRQPGRHLRTGGDRCLQAGRHPHRKARPVRRAFRPCDRRQGWRAVLRLRQQDDGRDRHQTNEGDRDARDRPGPGCGGLRSWNRDRLQLQRSRWHPHSGQTGRGKWQPVETVTTEPGARTMAVDTKTHKVYLLTAEFGPMPEAQAGKRVRPPVLPDTFHVLVVGK
jgi:YVTN family beta-propeller protein